ncbi:MAG: helix-turn-helix domain-containing protein [Pirellulaceae bacterium]
MAYAPTDMPAKYTSVSGAARYLGIGVAGVFNHIKAGRLPAIDCRTTGACRPLYRISHEALAEFEERRAVGK